MRYMDIHIWEKRGDFSVKEFQISLYNQINKHEIGVVKNIQKKDAFRHPCPLLT